MWKLCKIKHLMFETEKFSGACQVLLCKIGLSHTYQAVKIHS